MDVRERDDAEWDGLPGGLAFSGDLDDDVEPPPRRGWQVAAWLVLLGLLAGAGGAAGLRWYGEADVRDVLSSSTATYAQALTRLRSAPDVESLAAAAAGAPGVAARLDDDLARRDGGGGGRRAAVAAQVAAERDVLLAVGALGEVDRAPLRVWGDAHAAIRAAVTAEERARSGLLVADAEGARRLPDTPAVLRRINSTVGEAVVGDVTRSAGALLTDLGAATGTADLRAVAERAEAQRTAVAAAQEGLGGSGDGAVLAAFAGALQAVAELRALTPAETSGWPPVRTRLDDALRVVADADSSLEAGTVRAQLPLVLAAVDELVDRAQEAHAAWQPVYDAALAEHAADGAALRAHAERVRAVAAQWNGLFDAVAQLQTEPVEERAPAVEEVAATADQLYEALVAAVPPAALSATHGDLLSALDGVRRPLVPVVVEPECLDCPESGTAAPAPVDDGVDSAAEALPAWDPALAAWEAAVTAAEAEITGRALPPPPQL